MDDNSLSKLLDGQQSCSHTPRLSKRKRKPSTSKDTDDSNKHRVAIAIEDLTKPSFIEVICNKRERHCGQNLHPKWHRDTGHYVALSRKHCPHWCTMKRVWMIPMDNDIPFMLSTKAEYQKRAETKRLKENR